MSTTMSKMFPAKSKEIENEEEQVENKMGDSIEQESDLLQLVHDDNKAVAELFFQFSQAEEDEEKQELFDKIKSGLTLHAGLVEEILYPLVPESAEEEDKEDAEKLVFEAEAGNYIASIILDELEVTEVDDDYFEAKLSILCGLVKEQVKREEKNMFEKLQAADLDFEELGQEYSERKSELEEEASAPKAKAKAKTNSRSTAAKKSSGKAPAKSAKSTSAKTTGKKATARKAPAKKTPAKKAPAKSSSKTSAKTSAKKKTGKKSR